MTDFHLTENDKATGLWLRLKAHLADRLAEARQRNDDASLTEQQTAALRGRIACLKSIIGLGDDRPPTGNEAAPHGAATMRRL